MSELVSFGETMLRLSPPAGDRLETARELELRIGGAESNVAVAAARMGADATWISKLPDSPLGRRVLHTLHANEVNTEIVWSVDERQGTYYIEFGERPRGTQVIYDRADAAITTATPSELPLDVVEGASYFLVSGITPALSDQLRETTATLLERARAGGATTVLDLNYRAKLWDHETAASTIDALLDAVDLFVLPERDAAALWDIEGDRSAVTETIRSRWNLETVILTCGAWGAVARTATDYVEQRAFETDTADPIGTGDTFLGVTLGQRIRGAELATAMEWGAAGAALKRTIQGDIAVITPGEIERVIDASASGVDR